MFAVRGDGSTVRANVAAPLKRLIFDLTRAEQVSIDALKQVLYLGLAEADVYTAKVDEAIQITAGEPSAVLFERPAGYIERSPVQR